MEHNLMIARSVTYAQRMQRVLEQEGILSQIFRAPKGLSTAGCSYAVRIRSQDLAQALSALHRGGLGPVSVYLSRGGFYQEVAL